MLSYEEVLDRSEGLRHVLLGNGFSIACKPELFRYDKLFDQADFTEATRAYQAFRKLGTTNFEAVIRALRDFAVLAELYAADDPKAKQRAEKDADKLREILVSAVADCHPNLPFDVEPDAYRCCREFLRPYKSINTLNYDLLMYWALMQDELGDEEIPCDDGFRKPAEDADADYVTWDPDNSNTQSVRYLHGALHLYDTGMEMRKFTWINTGIPLVGQIRAALQQNYYPVFVSEGTSAEKITRIRHNDYLCKMYRGFTQIGGSLVVFGHSLDECDDHIFSDRIGRHGKTSKLFVSIYGDPASDANRTVIRKAKMIATLRPPRRPLSVEFFDASTATVW
ncbi:MAG: DUF4917 family protein [Verrucomicrobiota bacterium]